MTQTTSNFTETYLQNILKGFNDSKTAGFKKEVEQLLESFKDEDFSEISKTITKSSLTRIDIDSPEWTFVSARILLNELYKEASKNRGYNESKKYGDFFQLVELLVDKNLYDSKILEWYSKQELQTAGSFIEPSHDEKFTYIGLRLIKDRYLASGYKGEIYELPQERFLMIALTLMSQEKTDRLELVKEAYWALSNFYMTVATPTFSNSGKPKGQLSSCFIDTVEDSIDGIYLDNWDNARVSKNGGGIGVYLGKIRAKNSPIKKFIGKSSGVIPWIKNLNNTAISVDQEGKRQGAIAVYLDLWHKDLFEFLQIGTNNGDERLKARDVHPGICVPDLFMELAEADSTNRLLNPDASWYLFDPHEVEMVMGWRLEDCYDEKDGEGTWRERYQACIDNPNLSRKQTTIKEVIQAIIVSQLETGHPYVFYRDTVNRFNSNKHKGIIYCSNLCTEIAQNMSPTAISDEYLVDENGESVVVVKRKVGDFVVCNLASLNLGNCVRDGVISRVTKIAMIMLDNVIDVNKLPLIQADVTNKRYRPVGLGTFGWHHALAVSGIDWDSQESIKFADAVYEEIAFNAISTSVELGEKKGSYPYFEGSDYNTGDYFELRQYKTEGSQFDWDSLKERAKKAMRNGYWGAVAPNSSTGLIAGSTQGIDPFYDNNGMYIEEKKDFKIRVVAPDMSPETFPYYWKKGAYSVNQYNTIKQNEARQRHIDQAVSFNLYVPANVKAKDLFDLHRQIWKSKIKTSYYVHSKGNIIEADCEACQ